jgi:hypothetical protein
MAGLPYTAMESTPSGCLKEINDLTDWERNHREPFVPDKEGDPYGAYRGFAVSHSRDIASAPNAGLLYWKVPGGFASHTG